MIPVDVALPVGSRLGGCAVEAVLAADADGIVYRMTDSLLLGRVAIKEYFPRALAERSGTELRLRDGADEAAFIAGARAFSEEARQLASWQHPGLLRVLDAFEANGTLYRVMPLMEGVTLAQARRERGLTPDVVWLREMMLALLAPLEGLHAAGLLHGDIHPGKVLLGPGDRPLLMGFGAVRSALEGFADTAYTPLEQTALGGHLPRGAWTDLYALAATAWFGAIGRDPVRATERRGGVLFVPAAALDAALAGPSSDARDRVQLVAAVDRAMALLPPDRPQSAAEFRSLFTAAAVAAPAPAPVAEPAPAEVVAPPAAIASAPMPNVEISFDPIDAPWQPTAPRATPARMLPPQSDRGRRLTLGAWTAALLLGAAAGAMAWRWNDVLQASQSLASAVRPPAAVVQAPVPVAAPVVPPPAEPATAQVAAPQPAAAQVSAAPQAPAAPQVAMAPPATANPAPQELPEEFDRVPAPSAGPPAAREPEVSEPVPAKPPQRQTARKTTKPPPSAQRTVARAPAAVPAPTAPTSPRSVCGARQNFSLYYCMQTQCRKAEFSGHAQCRQLRATDEVS